MRRPDGTGDPIAAQVRRYVEPDFDRLVSRWHETNVASYPYVAAHQRHTLDDARTFFRQQVVARCAIWIAHGDDELLGLLALEAPWIRQFAVFPEFQRRGIGTALLRHARDASPSELRLFTFQRNVKARAFYEKHGFAAVAFGRSPAPELEPDVEYRFSSDTHRRGIDARTR
jgi:ribosomal protein S18 acetylase RimI-like enzyme